MIRSGKRAYEVLGEDLHVAGEHDQIDPLALEQRDLALLLRGLRLLVDREDVERDTELRRDAGEVRMVRDHERDLAGQLAEPVADQQIVQAVLELRDEDRDALRAVRVGDAPAHLVAAALDREQRLELVARDVELGEIELDALAEDPLLLVEVLLRLEDVRAVIRQQLRHRRDQSLAVGTAQQGASRSWSSRPSVERLADHDARLTRGSPAARAALEREAQRARSRARPRGTRPSSPSARACRWTMRR